MVVRLALDRSSDVSPFGLRVEPQGPCGPSLHFTLDHYGGPLENLSGERRITFQGV